jgi:CheY-like chemotaxis protein
MAKILIVEDDLFISDIYKRQLVHAGHEVDVVANGKQAVEIALKNIYSLIFLDVMLPGMDGISVLKTLKQNPLMQLVPVIMLSNLAQDSVMEDCKKSGAADYWVKDQLLPNQLVEQVNELLYELEKRSSQQPQ